MPENRFETFLTLLCRLPPSTWDTVLEGPAWKWMRPYSNGWDFGPFAALFVTLGLNNYQTKGKAEGYWPKALAFVALAPVPTQPSELRDALEPFYRNDRLGAIKVERLKRFLASDLCKTIWVNNASSLGMNFERTWRLLAERMRQQPTDKTIAFAMKCLAYALLMVGEIKFDFGDIPVPVDSRVRMVSARLGISMGDNSTERQRWRTTLRRLCESGRAITMVQLDSLLWQIGTLPRDEMLAHLLKLGAGDLAQKIADVFDPILDVATPASCRTVG